MYATSDQIRLVRRERSIRRNVISFFILFLLTTGSLFTAAHFFYISDSSSHLHSPLAEAIPLDGHTTAQPEQEESSYLKAVVQKALEGTKGSYGIVVKNLKTGESYSSNEHKSFESASLYKLWVMGTVFKKIKDGKLQEDTFLSEDVKILNDRFNIASESAERTEGTIAFPIRNALEKMITISDNYAALLLTEKVRLKNVASFLSENGFSESKVGANGGAPHTTPYDVALFFEKLYQGKLINQTYSDKMLSLLKRQRLNHKIPKYLPDTLSIAHKTGELDEFTHDAGIVYSPEGDYILVVLTESNSRSQAEERIASISQNIYNYFNHDENTADAL